MEVSWKELSNLVLLTGKMETKRVFYLKLSWHCLVYKQLMVSRKELLIHSLLKNSYKYFNINCVLVDKFIFAWSADLLHTDSKTPNANINYRGVSVSQPTLGKKNKYPFAQNIRTLSS